jgi:hypothetical protein
MASLITYGGCRVQQRPDETAQGTAGNDVMAVRTVHRPAHLLSCCYVPGRSNDHARFVVFRRLVWSSFKHQPTAWALRWVIEIGPVGCRGGLSLIPAPGSGRCSVGAMVIAIG